VTDLRARRAGVEDEREEVAEGVALLGRDHEVARVLAEHLRARVARRPFTGVVEQPDARLAVVDAYQRLGRLREDGGERLAENEVVHARYRRGRYRSCRGLWGSSAML
jgi:hypothetical protein